MSVTALLVLAAEEAEHSPTAFYFAGGVLVVWAIVLSVIGMTKPDFPQSDGTTKGLYGLSAFLVVAAAATAVFG